MVIDGSTRVVGIFGAPIAQTASPAMHNAAFAALGMNWVYVAFHVEAQNLRSALRGARDMGFAGLNLTVPHKIAALDCVDELDPEAARLGAVNTVVIEAGRLRGFNTDGHGFLKAIKEEFNLSVKGKRILVLGAGGAGRAIAVQAALEGAAKLFVANRTADRIETISRQLRNTGCEFHALPLRADAIAKIAPELDIIVNATSVGLQPGESLGLPQELFSPKLAVYDTIYRPAQTELLRFAAAAGAKTANGASMLLHQAAQSFELWTQRNAPLPVMRRALRAALSGESP